MSKHPANPYWCQQHDQPIVILTRSDWDGAAQQGFLTTEHILDRLAGILGHALGDGFDEEGFLTALVADGHRLTHGVTVRLCTRDHPPPHIHVEVRGQPRLHLRLDLHTGDLLAGQNAPPGLGTQLRVAREYLIGHQEQLLARWDEVAAASPAHG